MKRALSAFMTLLIVCSLISPAAFASENSILDKFNELKDAGIFTGTGGEDDAALHQEMDRGSAAVIVARLAQLDTTAPAVPTFTDVNTSQPWYGYVEAAVKSGIIVGNGDGSFTPYEHVTFEQLAVMVAKTYAAAAGTEIDLTANSEVEGASDWAQAYIKAVLDLGLFDDVTDWGGHAEREALIEITYQIYFDMDERQSEASDGIGDLPMISRIEAGDFRNSANLTIDRLHAGEMAFLDYTAYDQYGTKIMDADLLSGANGITAVTDNEDLILSHSPSLFYFTVTAKDTAASQVSTITLAAAGSGQSVTKSIRIVAAPSSSGASDSTSSSTHEVPASPEITRVAYHFVEDGPSSATVTIDVYTHDANMVHYALADRSASAPTADQLINETYGEGEWSGSIDVLSNIASIVPAIISDAEASYLLYAIATDLSGKRSEMSVAAIGLPKVDIIGPISPDPDPSGKMYIATSASHADTIHYALLYEDDFVPTKTVLSTGEGFGYSPHIYGSKEVSSGSDTVVELDLGGSYAGNYYFYCIVTRDGMMSEVASIIFSIL